MQRRPTILDAKQIINILPHRYPFLLVDRIIHLDLENDEIIGQKNLTINEEFFQGHFPGVPIMPGVLILEALAQTGGILIHLKGVKEKIAVFLNIKEAKFRRPLVPGDVVLLYAKSLFLGSKGGRMKVEARVEDQVAVEAEISFALVTKEQL